MEYKLIGKLTKPFGLKGEMKVETYTDFIEDRFKKDTSVYVDINGFKKEFIVSGYRIHKDQLLIKFKDYEDINLIEKYKGNEIYKNIEDIKPLKEGEYYFSDIIGLDVYVNNKKIGTIKDMEEGVIYNFMRILKDDYKESLVPFLNNFIEKISLDEKKIDIKNIEGLL